MYLSHFGARCVGYSDRWMKAVEAPRPDRSPGRNRLQTSARTRVPIAAPPRPTGSAPRRPGRSPANPGGNPYTQPTEPTPTWGISTTRSEEFRTIALINDWYARALAGTFWCSLDVPSGPAVWLEQAARGPFDPLSQNEGVRRLGDLAEDPNVDHVRAFGGMPDALNVGLTSSARNARGSSTDSPGNVNAWTPPQRPSGSTEFQAAARCPAMSARFSVPGPSPIGRLRSILWRKEWRTLTS
jgi:hypothetical protein